MKTPRNFENTKSHESGFCSVFAILCVCFFFPILPRFHGTQKKRTWENTMAEHVQPSYFPTSFLDTKNPKAAIPNPYNLNRIPELLVPEIMDAMHTVSFFVSTPCHGTTLRLATDGGGLMGRFI